jgi:hypothetical protein
VLRGELLPDLLVVVDLSVGLFIQSFNSDAVRKRWVMENSLVTDTDAANPRRAPKLDSKQTCIPRR